jgi:hypothetical protein
MHDSETITRGDFEIWRSSHWLLFVQSLKAKRIKFFLYSPEGKFRVRHKDVVKYEGFDFDEAMKAFNEI